jgi:hypothetical protein
MNKKILSIALMMSLMLMIFVPLGNLVTNATATYPNPTVLSETVIGGPSATFGTDPAGAYDIASSMMIQQVLQPLYMYNNLSTDNFIPLLANWWYGYDGVAGGFTNSSGPVALDDQIPSNLTYIETLTGITPPSWAESSYVFHIRPDVYWQNESYGTVEPSDVVYSIQRVILLDADTGVQWLLTTPMLGVGSIGAWMEPSGGFDYNASQPLTMNGGLTNTVSLGYAVETCVQGNNANGYVVFNLWEPYSPFVQIITQSWAMVMCQKWVTQKGGVNTNLPGYGYEALTNNAHNYTEFVATTNPSVSPLMAPSVIDSAYPMMGSGQYILEKYNPDPNVGYEDFVYFPNYWGEWPVDVPAWTEPQSQTGPGTIATPPSSPPYGSPWSTPNPNYNGTNTAQKDAPILNPGNVLGFAPIVLIDVDTTWSNRQFLFLSTSTTQSDLTQVPMTNVPQLSLSGLSISAPWLPGVDEQNVTMLEADYLYYCYNVSAVSAAATGAMPTLGGVANATLFSDRDLREAIMYLFNEAAYIAGTWYGAAKQETSYICDGILYYNASVPVRLFNITEAVDLLKEAWGGQVWSKGISFDVIYNAGNTEREAAATMIYTALLAIDAANGTSFYATPTSVSWSSYMEYMPAQGYPVFIVGWLADYPDPDDWAQPFMMPTTGTYSGYSQAIGIYPVNPVTNAIGYGMDYTSLNLAWSTMDIDTTTNLSAAWGPMPYTSSLAGYPGFPYGTVVQINDSYVSALISTAPTIPNGPLRQAVYNELMDIFYAEAQGYPLDQPVAMAFWRDWVYGINNTYTLNPVAVGTYFCQLWKGTPYNAYTHTSEADYAVYVNAVDSITNLTVVHPALLVANSTTGTLQYKGSDVEMEFNVTAEYVTGTPSTIYASYGLEIVNINNASEYEWLPLNALLGTPLVSLPKGVPESEYVYWNGTYGPPIWNGTYALYFTATPEGTLGADVYATNSTMTGTENLQLSVQFTGYNFAVDPACCFMVGPWKMGNIGSRVNGTNTYGVFSGTIGPTDLSLFLGIYHSIAPAQYDYLGDLGSRVNGTNLFFAYNPTISATDLSLFLECYHGLGPTVAN